MNRKLKKFIIAMLKSPGIDYLPQKSFSPAEYRLAEKIKEYEDFELKISYTKKGKLLLLWSSRLNQTIACQVSAIGVCFSGMSCYYEKYDSQIPVSSRFYEGTETGIIITEEVKKVKELILSYDKKLQKYFY